MMFENKFFYSPKSFINGLGETLELIDESELYDKISLGLNADFIYQIGYLRGLAFNNAYDINYRLLKKELPFFYGCCLREKHCKESYPIYNGNIQIDLDFKNDISSIGINLLKESLRDSKYIRLGFISPSGKGLKLLIKTSNYNYINYKKVIKDFSAYLKLNFNIDPKYVDTNVTYKHVCFMSYDPKPIYNKNSNVFEVEEVIMHNNLTTTTNTSPIIYSPSIFV